MRDSLARLLDLPPNPYSNITSRSRLQASDSQKGSVLMDVNGTSSEALATEIDYLFMEAVGNLKEAVPNFKAVAAAKTSHPAKGNNFMSSGGGRRGGNDVINLSEEALIKGGAAGIIQHVLEETVNKALALYPPP